MMETVVCNLCGCADATTIYALPDYLLGRENVLSTFVKCNACGLIYQNPRPTLDEMVIHYPPEYESYAPEPNGENASWLLRWVIQYGITKRCRFVTRYKRAGRLLDVGCATGTFLRGMQSRGNWELYGVEINEHAVHIACERYGLNVRVGTLEQAEYPDEFFDAVTMWEVLEHLHDPAASLRETFRILKRDGIAVIRVPNKNSGDATSFGRYWAGLDPPRHLYVFEKATLSRLLTENRFLPIDWSSKIGAYPTFLLSLRFWATARIGSSSTRDLLIKSLSHPISRVLVAPLFYLRSLALRGTSLVVTAKKDSRTPERDLE